MYQFIHTKIHTGNVSYFAHKYAHCIVLAFLYISLLFLNLFRLTKPILSLTLVQLQCTFVFIYLLLLFKYFTKMDMSLYVLFGCVTVEFFEVYVVLFIFCISLGNFPLQLKELSLLSTNHKGK